jgi:hypothetical protein
MRRLSFLLVASALLVSSAAQAAPCVWADGSDPTAPADDPGRGVADWAAHHNHVMKGAGLSNAHKLVAARFEALKACLDQETYARVYADASILLGSYGRANAGWKDGVDPAAPADDQGRGIAKWRPHFDHVKVGVGMTNASKLVGDRMQGLTKVPKPIYARIYADMSILLVNYARISN